MLLTSRGTGGEGVPLCCCCCCCCRPGRVRGRVVHHLGRPGSQFIGISMTQLSATPSTQQIFHWTCTVDADRSAEYSTP